jgi:hypothetical protein
MYYSLFLKCDDYGCKNLLDYMKIDVEGGRCMIRLGLQLVSELREKLVEKREVRYP